MRGELIGVWSETRRDIWQALIDEGGVPDEVFSDLYRDLARALKSPPSAQKLADIIDNPLESREAFDTTTSADLVGERELIVFFEAAHDTLEEFGGDDVSNRYFNLVATFIEKFSLRYDLRRPCIFCPTLPGLITSVLQHIRSTSHEDAHLAKLNHEFEEALRDLRHGRTEARIKSCLSKQYVLIEGIANVRNGTSGETLGQRCVQASWPHPTLRAAAGNIYGFRSDYPGLGHAGTPTAVLRDIDDRELVGVSCMLLGVVPYVDSTVSLGPLYGDRASPIGDDRAYFPASRPDRLVESRQGRIRSLISRLKAVLGL
jgi:hypothetical protein